MVPEKVYRLNDVVVGWNAGGTSKGAMAPPERIMK